MDLPAYGLTGPFLIVLFDGSLRILLNFKSEATMPSDEQL
jgi:hypothetical protein